MAPSQSPRSSPTHGTRAPLASARAPTVGLAGAAGRAGACRSTELLAGAELCRSCCLLLTAGSTRRRRPLPLDAMPASSSDCASPSADTGLSISYGSVTRNTEPLPGSLSAEMSPPCKRAMSRQTARPSPREPFRFQKPTAASPSVKRRSSWSFGMPTPVSCTSSVSTSRSSSWDADTRTCPERVDRSALSSRPKTSCAHLLASASIRGSGRVTALMSSTPCTVLGLPRLSVHCSHRRTASRTTSANCTAPLPSRSSRRDAAWIAAWIASGSRCSSVRVSCSHPADLKITSSGHRTGC
mmetsp:Transcript_92173/g.257521  ORF Transcript_92173/g.257521 Transcript_92173/m.257521 type:complete len:298 (+) Transcript_92173:377-1270(+)